MTSNCILTVPEYTSPSPTTTEEEEPKFSPSSEQIPTLESSQLLEHGKGTLPPTEVAYETYLPELSGDER
jgi:hypothetical protein